MRKVGLEARLSRTVRVRAVIRYRNDCHKFTRRTWVPIEPARRASAPTFRHAHHWQGSQPMDKLLSDNRFTGGMFIMTSVWVGLLTYMSIRALIG